MSTATKQAPITGDIVVSNNGNRDERGRFLTGKPGISTGRPTKLAELRAFTILAETATDDKLQAIVDKALADAAKGDWRARTFVFEYLCGRPENRTSIVSDTFQDVHIKVSRADNS